jgi:hypothetical protein
MSLLVAAYPYPVLNVRIKPKTVRFRNTDYPIKTKNGPVPQHLTIRIRPKTVQFRNTDYPNQTKNGPVPQH